MKAPLFRTLEIETSANCNRTCETCLRESYPDRTKVADWFTSARLSAEVIYRVIDEAVALGFAGDVNLQHYNEPLLDNRLEGFGLYARRKGLPTRVCTNGDFLTEDRARVMDEAFDTITIALYMPPDRAQARMELLLPYFRRAKVKFTGGGHIVTHFSPMAERTQHIQKVIALPCHQPWLRFILDHRGEMLLCCDDMPGHFDLGNAHESSVEELWFNERHLGILKNLSQAGGRGEHAHCASCPRQAGPLHEPVKKFLHS